MKIPKNARPLTDNEMRHTQPRTRLMLRQALAARQHILMAANMWRDMPAPTYITPSGSAQIYHGANEWDGERVAVFYTENGGAFVRQWDCYTLVDTFEGDHIIKDRDTRECRAYLCDEDGATMLVPFIVALTHGRCLAGYRNTDTNENVYFTEVHENQSDAALRAHELAERYAADEYAYNERWRQAQDMHDQREAAMVRLRECIVLRHNGCMSYVRAEALRLVQTIRKLTATLQKEYSDIAL